MSLHGSPPRRETLGSMTEEILTEMRTRSADPFDDDMFIRRASSGRTAQCIEGPGTRNILDYFVPVQVVATDSDSTRPTSWCLCRSILLRLHDSSAAWTTR